MYLSCATAKTFCYALIPCALAGRFRSGVLRCVLSCILLCALLYLPFSPWIFFFISCCHMILSDLYHVFGHAFCYVILLITSPGVLNALWFCYAMAPQDFACYSAMRFSLAILPYYSPSPLLSFAPTLIQLPFHLSPLSPLFQSCSPASPLPPSPLRPALSLLRLPDLLPAQTLIYIQQGHFYRKASLCAFLVNIYIYILFPFYLSFASCLTASHCFLSLNCLFHVIE